MFSLFWPFLTPWTVAHQPPLSVGILQARILEWVGCHALFQRIFSTQGSNPGLPHCRWIFYHLSHQGSPCCPIDVSQTWDLPIRLKLQDRQRGLLPRKAEECASVSCMNSAPELAAIATIPGDPRMQASPSATQTRWSRSILLDAKTWYEMLQK